MTVTTGTDAFFRNLQQLLVEGDFASTYKFALLLALTRWAVEHPDHDPREPVDAGAFAAPFLELYWPQVQPFAAPPPAAATTATTAGPWPANAAEPRPPFGRRRLPPTAPSTRTAPTAHTPTTPTTPTAPITPTPPTGILRQDPANDLPRVLRHILDERQHGSHSLLDIPTTRRTTLLRDVRRTIRDMPLWRLQKLRGGRTTAFLYRRGRNASEILFEPTTIATLAAFAPLIEQIVRAAWLRFVLYHNPALVGTPAAQLEDFLFPSDRATLDRFRDALLPIQSSHCFYCDLTIRGDAHVDHFLPWSLYPRDLGHNFVLAHADCNREKRDHLAATDHLARWCRRNRDDERLAAAFDRAGLPHDWPALRGAARSLYGIAAATDAPVWRARRELVPLDGAWRALLAG